MTPEMQDFLKSQEEWMAAQAAKHACMVEEIERKESRILRDILRDVLCDKPEDFVRFAWGKARAEYGRALDERVGKWGKMDLLMFLSVIMDSYCLQRIIDRVFEHAPDYDFPRDKAPVYVLSPRNRKPKGRDDATL